MPKGSSRGARGTGSHNNAGNREAADIGGGGGDRNRERGGNRSIATRGLSTKAPAPKSKTSPSASKQRNLGGLRDLVGLDEEEQLSKMPGAPSGQGGGGTGEPLIIDGFVVPKKRRTAHLRGQRNHQRNSRAQTHH